MHAAWLQGTCNIVVHTLLAYAGTDMSFPWAQISTDTQQIAAAATTSSLVQAQSQLFLNNFASLAGGAIYGTDLDSLQMTCSDGTRADHEGACASWVGNRVSADDANATQLQVSHLALLAC